MEVPPLLVDHPLFADFTRDDLEALCEASQVRTFEPAEVIIRRGEPGRFLGLILQGRIEALGVDEAGGARRLGELGEGDCFGEISLISGEATTADVRAVIPSRVLLIPHDAVSATLATHPTALQQLARLVTQRLRNQLQRSAAPRATAPMVDAATPEGTAGSAARVLVLESGLGSLRYSYYDTHSELRNREGSIEGIGGASATHTYTALRRSVTATVPGTRAGALEALLAGLTEAGGALDSLTDLSAIAHRVVHGGERFGKPALVDEAILKALGEMRGVAPPELAANLEGLELCRVLAPETPQVAVFETALFQGLPPAAFLYAMSYDLYREDGLRRPGADGLAHHQAALLAAAHLDTRLADLRLVSCCLGPQSSVCALAEGSPVEASGGVRGWAGLPGPDAAGEADPGLVFYLCREKGLAPAEAEKWLSEQSGLRALSGLSGDLEVLAADAGEGYSRAALALDVFARQVRRLIGAGLVALGGWDALVFTGPYGESVPELRTRICQGLGGLGLRLDPRANAAPEAAADGVSEIGETRSLVRVLIAPADPHRMVASEALAALGRSGLAAAFRTRRRPIPISVSAHHVHLRQDHVEALFGPGHQLTVRANLSQPGQFACEEAVTLVGPRGKVERVRVLGPVRSDTQVEISRTEEFRLGIDAPVRASGDTQGSPGVRLEGPAGGLDLAQGVICAARHVHMSPEDALRFGVRDRDGIVVRVEGGRGVSFRDVAVRVHPDFRLDMHVDTDEGNAAELDAEAVGYMDKVERRA